MEARECAPSVSDVRGGVTYLPAQVLPYVGDICALDDRMIKQGMQRVIDMRLRANEPEPTVIQLADYDHPMRVPFGIDSELSREGEPSSDHFKLELCISQCQTLDLLSAKDARNVELAVALNEQGRLFSRIRPRAFIENLYYPLIARDRSRRPGDDRPPYYPRVRVKLVSQGPHRTLVYEKTGEAPCGRWLCTEVAPEDWKRKIVPGVYVVPVVVDLGLWFMGYQFGNTLIALSLILVPEPKNRLPIFNEEAVWAAH